MQLTKNKTRLIILLVVMPFLLYALFNFAMGYMLFGPDPCNEWRPNMSADEKIKMALEFSNSLPAASFLSERSDGTIGKDILNQVPYTDINQVIEQNPGCCKLYSSATAHTNDPSEILSQYDDGTVLLEYKAQYKDISGNIHTGTISNYFDLNTCRN